LLLHDVESDLYLEGIMLNRDEWQRFDVERAHFMDGLRRSAVRGQLQLPQARLFVVESEFHDEEHGLSALR